MTVFEVIEAEELIDRANAIGNAALHRLRTLRQELPIIREVRGLGLLIEVELQDPAGRDRGPTYAGWVMWRAMELGLSFKVLGGHVLTLAPPLTISDAEMEVALGILERCLREISDRPDG